MVAVGARDIGTLTRVARMTDPLPPLHVTRRRCPQSRAIAGVGVLGGFDWPVARAIAQTRGVLAPNTFVRRASDNPVRIIATPIESGRAPIPV